MKVMIRADREAGLVRGWFATLDEQEKIEMATLSIRLADEDKQAFEDFKNMLSNAMNRRVAKVTGITPETIEQKPHKPHEKN